MSSINPLKIQTLSALALVTVCSLLSACAMQPLAPTLDAEQVARLAVGQSQADVERIMRRPGRKISYPLRPEARVELWRYEDHFNSRCVLITYGVDLRVKDFELFEREKDERGKLGVRLSGSC